MATPLCFQIKDESDAVCLDLFVIRPLIGRDMTRDDGTCEWARPSPSATDKRTILCLTLSLTWTLFIGRRQNALNANANE